MCKLQFSEGFLLERYTICQRQPVEIRRFPREACAFLDRLLRQNSLLKPRPQLITSGYTVLWFSTTEHYNVNREKTQKLVFYPSPNTDSLGNLEKNNREGIPCLPHTRNISSRSESQTWKWLGDLHESLNCMTRAPGLDKRLRIVVDEVLKHSG